MINQWRPLLEFLSEGKPPLRLQVDNDPCPGTNKEDPRYDWWDIKRVSSWEDFNYESMKQNYSEDLSGVKLKGYPFFGGLRTNNGGKPRFKSELNEVSSRANVALCFALDKKWNPSIGPFTPVTIVKDGEATVIDGYKPDLAFIKEDIRTGQITNRCLGNINVSWEWKSTWKSSTDERELTNYKKVLAQLNFYMKLNNTRYGFIATDIELVPVRRELEDGHLGLADSIPWTGKGKLTYLMGLFYLGILAAGDDWKLGRGNDP